MRASDPPPRVSPLPGEGSIPPPARLPRGLIVPEERPSAAPRANRSSISIAPNRSSVSIAPNRSSVSIAPNRSSASMPPRLSYENVRKSILSMLPPIPISRTAATGPLFLVSVFVFMVISTSVWAWSTGRMPDRIATVLHLPKSPTKAAPTAAVTEADEDSEPDVAGPSVRMGRSPVSGGILSLPMSFAPASDGAFDLIVHFHGNTDLALESYDAVGSGAAIVMMNLGTGSGVYEDRYSNPQAMTDVMERTTAAVKARGVANAHIRRIALVGWSAGYGAVLKILDHAPHADKVDAVILLDGLHIGYRDGTHTVDPMPMMPVERFARRAADGEKLFVVTHSNIDPVNYLGVKATTDVLLKDLGIERETISGNTSLPILTAMVGVLPKDEMKALEKRSEAKKGGLVIRGYAGDQPAHHIAHLMQMSQIALPLLVDRWTGK